jgi:hypothetical protein
MPYQGKAISLAEMLDVLVNNGRTEAAAAVELERAFEDNAIRLLLPDGADDKGETLYCEMSPLGRASVIAVLRDFPNRMRIPLIRHVNTPIEMVAAARAIRIQFEAACGLAGSQSETPKIATRGPVPGTIDRFGESDRARFSEIEALMKAGKTLTAACDALGPTLEGPATAESKARRLRGIFKKMKSAN